MKKIEKVKVKRVRLKGKEILIQDEDDNVIVERRLKIFLNDKELLHILCIPTHVKELVTGFLYTEGIIKEISELSEIEIEFKPVLISRVYVNNGSPSGKRTITSGCAGGITFERKQEYSIKEVEFKISPVKLRNIFKEFEKKAELFRITGGVHSAALCDINSIVFFSEDIGRHNAIDKVVGYALLNNIDLRDKIIFTSGRLSSEMISKCLNANVSFVVSRCAPTHRAIKIAENAGITLIGFMRGPRFNIYTYPERVEI